ncbi:hypothetical protein [Labrenzia sp. VG12]|uniref:hypothetical protein n=1 Tax=Labrenzia sp. VG12 TaxID=2021862 RepID=UPI0012FD54B3|nr:hypothetical protein [Labrenzia sp. VG12]
MRILCFLLVILSALPARAEIACQNVALAAYTRLGFELKEIEELLEADLLGIELMKHTEEDCRFAFEVEFIDKKGRVDVALFEAQTLDPVFFGFDYWKPVDADALFDEASKRLEQVDRENAGDDEPENREAED